MRKGKNLRECKGRIHPTRKKLLWLEFFTPQPHPPLHAMEKGELGMR